MTIISSFPFVEAPRIGEGHLIAAGIHKSDEQSVDDNLVIMPVVVKEGIVGQDYTEFLVARS